MKKSRLFSILLTFCICVCTFVVGVWAAKTATVSNGGSVSFVAKGIYAEATGTISGAGTVKSGTTDYTPATGQSAKLPTLVFDYQITEGGEGTLKGGESGVLPSWKNNNLSFNKMGDKITLAITVKNLATDRDLYAQLVNNNKSIKNLTTTITGGTKNIAFLAKGGTNSVTFTIELEPTNRNMEIPELTYSFTLNLSLEEIVPPPEDNIEIMAQIMDQNDPTQVNLTLPKENEYIACALEDGVYGLDLSIFEGIEDVTLNPNISRTLIVNLKFKNTLDQWMDVQALDGFLEYLQGTSTDLRLNIPNTGEAIAPTSFTSTQETNTGLTKEVTLQLKVRYLSSSTATLKPFANVSGSLFKIKTSVAPTFLPRDWAVNCNWGNGYYLKAFTSGYTGEYAESVPTYLNWNSSYVGSELLVVEETINGINLVTLASRGRIYSPQDIRSYDLEDNTINVFLGDPNNDNIGDLSGLDTSRMTTMEEFGVYLTGDVWSTIGYFSGGLFLDTSNVSNMKYAFGLDEGVEIDVRNFSTSNVNDFSCLGQWRYGPTESVVADYSSWEVSASANIEGMFFLGTDYYNDGTYYCEVIISRDLWHASTTPSDYLFGDFAPGFTFTIV